MVEGTLKLVYARELNKKVQRAFSVYKVPKYNRVKYSYAESLLRNGPIKVKSTFAAVAFVV